MADQLVNITKTVTLTEDCSHQWVPDEVGEHPLQLLAAAECGAGGWVMRCRIHGTVFSMTGACPAGGVTHEAGSSIAVDAAVAKELVERGLAEFPTNPLEHDPAVWAQLERANALLENEGLPLLDAEALGVVRMEGRRDHYGGKGRRAPDRRAANLAADLGLDPGDVEEMRGLLRPEG